MDNLSRNLVEYRKAYCLTQEELAGKLFVTRQAVSRWERGECTPDLETLVAISELYSVSVDDLLKLPEIEWGKNEPTILNDVSNADELKTLHNKETAKRMVIFGLLETSTVALILGIIYAALIAVADDIWLAWFLLPILAPLIFLIRFRQEIDRRWIAFIFPVPFVSGIIFLLVHIFMPQSTGGWLAFLLIPLYYAIAIVIAVLDKSKKVV